MAKSDGDIVAFWRAAGPAIWFGKDAAFDRLFHELFLSQHERAAAGQLSSWLMTPEDALGLLLLLDQFPRNAFRGMPRMYATDEMARHYADLAVRAGLDERIERELRLFFYLPFAHSEHLADQERSVRLHERLGYVTNALRHQAIIKRFGRFPHRNPILGRQTTREEQVFLDAGGFAG